jgi:hypothetical protein
MSDAFKTSSQLGSREGKQNSLILRNKPAANRTDCPSVPAGEIRESLYLFHFPSCLRFRHVVLDGGSSNACLRSEV